MLCVSNVVKKYVNLFDISNIYRDDYMNDNTYLGHNLFVYSKPVPDFNLKGVLLKEQRYYYQIIMK